MDPAVLECRRITISGYVQGVFFWGWTVGVAQELGVTGWVRNRSNGTVEVLVMGAPKPFDRFIARMREGAPASRVDAVHIEDATPEDLETFTRRPTV